MTLTQANCQHLSIKNLLGLLALLFFIAQPWDRHIADVLWLMTSLISLIYVSIKKYQGYSFIPQKPLKTLLWLFTLMPAVSIISYLASPLDTLTPTTLEPDTRWLLMIPIIFAMRDTHIGPKWILIMLSSYAISTFISATIETNYLSDLWRRASGAENAVPYGMFNATIGLMLLTYFVSPFIKNLNTAHKGTTTLVRTGIFILFLMASIAAFLSGTRAAILLIPLVICLLYLISYNYKKAIISIVIILAIGGSVAIDQKDSALVKRMLTTPDKVLSYFEENDRASKLRNQRLEQWKESWCIFTIHPILGTGPRSFKYAHQAYGGEGECDATQYLKQGSYQAHSVYFNTLSTLGLVGILAALLLSLALISTGISAFRQNDKTTKLGGSLLIIAVSCHAINGLTLDMWFQNHMLNKNLLIIALPLILIFSKSATHDDQHKPH